MQFMFEVAGDAKKWDFLQVPHKEHDFVLCQISELETDPEKTIAKCFVIGFKEEGKIKQLRTPFEPGTEVLKASEDFIRDIVDMESCTKCAYMGKLDNTDIDVHLDLQKLLTKHISILAKSGSGKSYTVGVLLEEIMERRIPLLIIDPHGEYSTLKYPNENPDDKERMALFKIEPKNYISEVQEYGDININPKLKPLKLDNNFDADELIHILPAKLNPNQQALIYAAMRNIPKANFNLLMDELAMTDGNAKWNLMSILDHMRKSELFSDTPTTGEELIQPGKCSIINLRGVEPEMQGVMVYKVLADLFKLRKLDKIPPFFAIIEEAHNFAPERGFGETKASKVLRTIASEGRKFGMGLCIVSQRPARVDKSVLSQCSTQMILKVTNPNDLRAITNSVEAITLESENEISSLPVGTSMIAGIAEIPLFVNIRPRKTKHGGEAANMVEDSDDDEENFLEKVEKFDNKDMMPLIKPKLSIKDLKLMSDTPIKSVQTFLIPALFVSCEKDSRTFNILVERTKGNLITDFDNGKSVKIPNIFNMSPIQIEILRDMNEKITPGKLVAEMGLDFSRAVDVIETLCKQGLLQFNTDKSYSLAEDVTINMERHEFFGKVEFDAINYDQKMEPVVDVKSIKDNLGGLVSITDYKECFMVWYKVDYE